MSGLGSDWPFMRESILIKNPFQRVTSAHRSNILDDILSIEGSQFSFSFIVKAVTVSCLSDRVRLVLSLSLSPFYQLSSSFLSSEDDVASMSSKRLDLLSAMSSLALFRGDMDVNSILILINDRHKSWYTVNEVEGGKDALPFILSARTPC